MSYRAILKSMKISVELVLKSPSSPELNFFAEKYLTEVRDEIDFCQVVWLFAFSVHEPWDMFARAQASSGKLKFWNKSKQRNNRNSYHREFC